MGGEKVNWWEDQYIVDLIKNEGASMRGLSNRLSILSGQTKKFERQLAGMQADGEEEDNTKTKTAKKER